MRRAPAAPLSRLLFRSVAGALAGAALLAGLVVGLLQLPVTATAAAAGSSAISLVDDDGGAALFSAVELSPGRPRTACVGLSARGSVDPTTEVRLSADRRSGDLSRFLTVSVDRGSVPAGGSCASFSGEQIWTGTLAELPGTDVAGIRTGWQPALVQRSVYRITVTLLDDFRAQGLTASASFRWSLTEAVPDPVPEPLPVPLPEPAPAPAPTVAPVPEPALGAGVVGAPDAEPTTAAASPTIEEPGTTPATTPPPAPAAPTSAAPAPAAPTAEPPTAEPPTSEAPPASDLGGSGGTDVVEAPPLDSGPVAAVAAAAQAVVEAVTQAVGQAVEQVGQTAVAVAHDGQFPVALVAVVAAFLFLQGRLDRRDPKLALARVREELSEYRDFPEPPTTETT